MAGVILVLVGAVLLALTWPIGKKIDRSDKAHAAYGMIDCDGTLDGLFLACLILGVVFLVLGGLHV